MILRPSEDLAKEQGEQFKALMVRESTPGVQGRNYSGGHGIQVEKGKESTHAMISGKAEPSFRAPRTRSSDGSSSEDTDKALFKSTSFFFA